MSDASRETVRRALEEARRAIPAIRRFLVGRRVHFGHGYELAQSADYPYAALIEFDDAEGLASYLAHPAHAAVGRLFAETSESALVHDFEVRDVLKLEDLLGRV